MNEQQTIEFLKAQREVLVSQMVLARQSAEIQQTQQNAQKAMDCFNVVKAKLEKEIGGTINEETLSVTPAPPNPAG